MNSFICLFLLFLIGFYLGALSLYLIMYNYYKAKDKTIEDYKTLIKIHNNRELKLIFINQSIKDYVKNQQHILKSVPIEIKKITDEDSIQVGRYMAFKDIEKAIIQLEKNSKNLANEK